MSRSLHLPRRRALAAILVCALVFALVPSAPGGLAYADTEIYYVDATGGNDGNAGTAAAPFKTITHAMDEATAGDTVYVNEGTYSDPDETFPISFTRGVTLRAMPGEDVVVDASGVIPGVSAFWIVDAIEDTVLEGFTVTGGFAGLTTGGGAIYISATDGSSNDAGWPHIVDNVFDDNGTTGAGGAIRMENIATGGDICTAYIAGNTFDSNDAASWGGAVYVGPDCDADIVGNSFVENEGGNGGGVAVSADGGARIDSNEFRGNSTDEPSQYGGGAVFSYMSDTVAISDNLFVDNSAARDGGAIEVHDTQGVAVQRNMIVANTCDYDGGAVAVTGAGTVMLSSNVLWDNFAVDDGGAIAVAASASATLVGCSVVDNTSTNGFDGAYITGVMHAYSTVFWHPEATPGAASTAEDVLGTFDLHYCLTRDTDLTGTGVKHGDPMFRDKADGDLMPLVGSPLIDGVTGPATTVATDIDGRSRPVDGNGDGIARHDIGAYERPVPDVMRLAGTSRYRTAMTVVKERFESAEYAIIASGEDYPDALSASGLAGALDAPLLLVKKNEVPSGLVSLLEDLGVKTLCIVGGDAAVSMDVEDALAKDFTVTRVWGSNRYATSAAVAHEIAAILGDDFGDDAFVARGDDFPDALAVAPLATNRAEPVLLTKPGELPAIVGNTVDNLDLTNIAIIGGTAAVNDTVKTALIKKGATVERVWGANRYATASAVAAWGDAHDLGSWDLVGIASGTNFPDALSGGVACGANGGLMLLTKPTELSSPTKLALQKNAETVLEIDVYGGTAAVDETVRKAINSAVGW